MSNGSHDEEEQEQTESDYQNFFDDYFNLDVFNPDQTQSSTNDSAAANDSTASTVGAAPSLPFSNSTPVTTHDSSTEVDMGQNVRSAQFSSSDLTDSAIGGPKNLVGVKRYKRIVAVERQTAMVKKQMDALMEFQKTVMSEAIAAATSTMHAQLQHQFQHFAMQLEERMSGDQPMHVESSEEEYAADASSSQQINPLMNSNFMEGVVVNSIQVSRLRLHHRR